MVIFNAPKKPKIENHTSDINSTDLLYFAQTMDKILLRSLQGKR